MSHFLQNLLDRHQEGSVSREVSHKVQPRPKSRFENNTGPVFFAQNDFNNSADFTPPTRSDLNEGTFSAEYDQVASPIITNESKPSERHTPVSAQHGFENTAIQPDFSHQNGDSNKRLEITARLHGQQPSTVQEISGKAAENKNHKQMVFLQEDSETHRRINLQQQTLSEEISPRIQPILQRLNNPQPQQTDDQRSIESQHEPAPSTDSHTSISAGEINPRIHTTHHRLNSQQSQHADGQRVIESQYESVSHADTNAPTSETNHRIQTILQHLNSQQPQHVENQQSIESQHKLVILSDTRSNTPTSETEDRIQTILQRLNTSLPQHEGGQQIDPSQHSTTSDRERDALMRDVSSPLITERNPGVIQPAVKLKKQSKATQLESHQPDHAGAVQIPSWLKEMQADFNTRWQQINSETKSERVINVTIGRIEVRAVQAETVKKPKVRNKPTGVMSLDDYLKQRESRRQK